MAVFLTCPAAVKGRATTLPRGPKAHCHRKTPRPHDQIIVQEKLDGSNVAVARLNGQIYALTRAGYVASTSPYEQHHRFQGWVYQNWSRFMAVLQEGNACAGNGCCKRTARATTCPTSRL